MKAFKVHIVMGLVLTVALLALLKLGPQKSIVSTGTLSKGHADLGCNDCHTPFRSFSTNASCTNSDCHPDQVMTPKERFGSVSCVSCHKEHLGASADLKKVGNDKCRRCHDPTVTHLRAPVQLAEKIKHVPRDCTGCHGNHSEHKLHPIPSIAEARKHLVAAHTKGNPLYHKDTCDKCHQDKGQATAAQASSKPGFFNPHVTHVRQLGIRCTWCHGTIDIRQKSGTSFRRTVMTERCVQCHEGEYYDTKQKGGT